MAYVQASCWLINGRTTPPSADPYLICSQLRCKVRPPDFCFIPTSFCDRPSHPSINTTPLHSETCQWEIDTRRRRPPLLLIWNDPSSYRDGTFCQFGLRMVFNWLDTYTQKNWKHMNRINEWIYEITHRIIRLNYLWAFLHIICYIFKIDSTLFYFCIICSPVYLLFVERDRT